MKGNELDEGQSFYLAKDSSESNLGESPIYDGFLVIQSGVDGIENVGSRSRSGCMLVNCNEGRRHSRTRFIDSSIISWYL